MTYIEPKIGQTTIGLVPICICAIKIQGILSAMVMLVENAGVALTHVIKPIEMVEY